jgi:translocator protein
MAALRHWQTWLALAVSVGLVAAVSALGSLVTLPKITGWYAELTKPWFMPPPWVFGPVWTTLYVMMAVAVWRIWLEPPTLQRRAALIWYAVQLALNALWSHVFFGMEQPAWALVVIVLLLGALTITLQRFSAVDGFAGRLLVPYLAWVAFAVVLNAAIVVLN